VLEKNALGFYKDQKHAKVDPGNYFHHEAPTELEGSSCYIATDYSKKPCVFRLKLATGGEFLFQGKDEAEMNSWIGKMNACSGTDSSSPSRAMTLPTGSSSSAGGKGDDSKRRSFFTLGKKK